MRMRLAAALVLAALTVVCVSACHGHVHVTVHVGPERLGSAVWFLGA